MKHKEYEMELRVFVRISAHDIEAAQERASKLRTEMLDAFSVIDRMEFATNFSLRPCHDRPAHISGYPDPHNARMVFDQLALARAGS